MTKNSPNWLSRKENKKKKRFFLFVNLALSLKLTKRRRVMLPVHVRFKEPEKIIVSLSGHEVK